MTPASAFGWVDSPPGRFFESACITAVADGDVGAVAHALGATDRRISFREAIAVPAVALIPVAGGVIAVEPNGNEATRLPVYSVLSASSRTATAFWNVEGDTRVILADRGVTQADSEDLGPADPGGADVHAFEEITERLGEPSDGSGRAWLLAIVAAYTGIVVDASIEAAEEYREIEPVLDGATNDPNDPFLGASDPNDEQLRKTAGSPLWLGSPELADWVYSATPARRRAFAIWAATHALERAELIDDPGIVEALSMVRAGHIGPLPADAAKLARQYATEVRRVSRTGQKSTLPLLRTRHRAFEALLYATGCLDPLRAALRAGTEAHLSYGRENTERWLAEAIAYFDRRTV